MSVASIASSRGVLNPLREQTKCSVKKNIRGMCNSKRYPGFKPAEYSKRIEVCSGEMVLMHSKGEDHRLRLWKGFKGLPVNL